MKKLLTLIFVISIAICIAAAIPSDEYCYKGRLIIHFKNGRVVEILSYDSIASKCAQKSAEERIKEKEFLNNLKPCI